jgi:hypothetical protein
MKWRQPLIVLLVLGFITSTLVLGLWGSFFYLLFIAKFVEVVAEFAVAVAPLWLLQRQLRRDMTDPSRAVQAGMRWWFTSYVVLCVTICFLPWFRPSFIPAVSSGESWMQYLVAAFVTMLLGAAIFTFKWFRYKQHDSK